ncbi:MAG: hypothetical protein ACRDZX_17795, partial [Acidimicrobiales bacterium]
MFEPGVIASSAPPQGGGTSTVCDAAHAGNCGTNFMAYQLSGEAPFNTQIGANALMSASSLPGVLANLNTGSGPPNAPASNGEAPGDNVWSANTYVGPWSWTAYLFGSCDLLPPEMTGDGDPCNVGPAQW